MHRISIIPSVQNIASRRVAEKVGGVCEGILRHRLFLHGCIHDACCYSLIPADMGFDRLSGGGTVEFTES